MLVVALFAAIPLLIAYMALRRQYHQLIVVAAAIASLILWGLLVSLPDQLGFDALLERLRHRPITSPADNIPLAVFGILRAFLTLIFPIWSAILFFRFVLRLAGRRIYDSTPMSKGA
jgi:hypothetical protein